MQDELFLPVIKAFCAGTYPAPSANVDAIGAIFLVVLAVVSMVDGMLVVVVAVAVAVAAFVLLQVDPIPLW